MSRYTLTTSNNPPWLSPLGALVVVSSRWHVALALDLLDRTLESIASKLENPRVNLVTKNADTTILKAFDVTPRDAAVDGLLKMKHFDWLGIHRSIASNLWDGDSDPKVFAWRDENSASLLKSVERAYIHV